MSITCVTVTGDRPEAFELCRRWIDSQTVKPDQWLVIDDGYDPIPLSLQTGMDYVRRNPTDGEGHTLVLNLTEALPHIKGDKILIMEDDDWYGPEYIKTMSYYLNAYDMVGEGAARYYFAPLMLFRRLHNSNHSSLCQTGFTRKVLPIFEKCIPGNPYVDARLWGAGVNNRYIFMDTSDKLKLHCSLKGLRGRKGIGEGHTATAKNIHYQLDAGLNQLIEWVGEPNARIYMNHVGQSFESSRINGIGRGSKPPKSVIRTRKGTREELVAPVLKEKVTVITCTGDRPESFALLQRWMAHQTTKPDQWIVIDDGKVPLNFTGTHDYYRREPTEKDYLHTLCLNLPIALDKVKYDKVIIMEDDDWYDPIYISYMSQLLDKSDLVGFSSLIFYFPAIQSYMEKLKVKQPALAQTGFRKLIIPTIKDICSKATKEYDLCGKGLVDEFLWSDPLKIKKSDRNVRLTTHLKTASGRCLPVGTVFRPPIPPGMIRRADKKTGAEYFMEYSTVEAVKTTVQCDRYLSIGMKGMPGRKGYTSHHNVDNRKYKKDESGKLLKSILKDDAKVYLDLFS